MGIQNNSYYVLFVKWDDLDGFLATLGLPPFADTEGWETDWDSQESTSCYTFEAEKIYIYDLEENTDVCRVKIW